MQWLALLSLALATSSATAEPLWSAEVRAGYGMAMGGGMGTTSRRLSPLVLDGSVAVAIRDEPRIFGYGGLMVETLDRNGVGAIFGVRWQPPTSRIRLSGGGSWVFAPYTLWGAVGSVGACTRGETRLCADVQLSAYFAGTDLAEGQTVTQAQLVFGVAFGG